ncbi:MAG: helix-turn-helix transcriptional regulator [Lachnospiraceae bacterium]|nr:helix-turn-helix transcriptional regulator [Lachnospiraceae bacterium]
MPFTEINVKEAIAKERDNNPKFAKAWDESRTEYKLLAELVQLRKEQKITQTELARRTGNKQQVISRIEKRENSPTLKTFCSLLNSLGYDLQIVKQMSTGN